MISIKPSQIPGSGLGLWATKDFKKGDVIVKYDGDKISLKECERRNQNQDGYGGYYLTLSKNRIIDAQYTLWAMGRYANDAAGLNRIKGLRNNAKYQLIKREAFIVASRNIKAGEEILVSYGRSYWNILRKVLNK
ncbi:MAG TPA: SET domain-containing protein [Bacteroidales bacterium]|nr:SET domain-containing protein [Bacteroidales bacterium]HOH83251.1 SET domain-containing protein [Bacteroidales bacterium]HPB26538.1 SET domain-containing protein [Bacteroidales bacterium]HQN16988.1 SET domain-containing protein [Bacteroidales bacterium]HQP14747.1 SET domain-containing protein [Bacteroidales bacterium]